MKTNRANLLAVLQAVKPGLANREILEQTTSFIFTGGQVLTYNDEVCCRHPLLPGLELEGAVQAKEMFALLNKMTDEEIEIETTDKELKVRGSKTTAGIKLEIATSVDEVLQVLGDPKDWAPLPEKFLAGLEFCQVSTGRDMTDPLLTCVCIDDRFVLSSDKRRITRFDMTCEGVQDLGLATGEQMLIPATSAKALCDYPVVEFDRTRGWLHFRTASGVIFSCRDVEGQWPAEKSSAILDGTKGEAVKLPGGLSAALERAGIFSASETKKTGVGDRVKVSLSDGQLVVRGEGEAGWLEEKSRVRYKGPAFDFDVSSGFLSAILAHSGEMMVGENLLKFEGPDFVHVVACMASR